MITDFSAGAWHFLWLRRPIPTLLLGPAVSSGAEGILYRGSITTTAGVTLDVAIKMLQPRFLSRSTNGMFDGPSRSNYCVLFRYPALSLCETGSLDPCLMLLAKRVKTRLSIWS